MFSKVMPVAKNKERGRANDPSTGSRHNRMDEVKSILQIAPFNGVTRRGNRNSVKSLHVNPQNNVQNSTSGRQIFAELRDRASIRAQSVAGNREVGSVDGGGSAGIAAAGAPHLSNLNDQAYNVFLEFTDTNFDVPSYVAFKRSDKNLSLNFAVFAVLLSFAATCNETHGARGKPLYAAALAAASVAGAFFLLSLSSTLFLKLSHRADNLSKRLRRACRFLHNQLGSTLHNAVVLAGQAATSLLLLGVALDTGAVALDLLVLSMVFVLVAQVPPLLGARVGCFCTRARAVPLTYTTPFRFF